MQYIVAGYNVAGDNITLRHPLINVLCIHLQSICHAAHAEDNEVKYLKIHNLLFEGKGTNKIRIIDSISRKSFSFVIFLYRWQFFQEPVKVALEQAVLNDAVLLKLCFCMFFCLPSAAVRRNFRQTDSFISSPVLKALSRCILTKRRINLNETASR